MQGCTFLVGDQIRCEQPVEHRYPFCSNHLQTLTRINVESCVRQIIQEQLGLELQDIRLASSFVDELGADSLDTVELMMAAEQVFGCEISDAAAETLTTPQNVIDYLVQTLSLAQRHWLTDAVDWEKAHASLRNDARRTQVLFEVVVSSALFNEYLERLRLQKATVVKLFQKAVGGSWIYHVTTVPTIAADGRLERADIFVLTDVAVAVFGLTTTRIRFHALPLRHIQFSYDLQIDPSGDVQSIEVRSALPPHLQIDTPVLTFSDSVGVDGALMFLRKVLRNQERSGA